jgi:hypothetical protein
MNSKTRPKRNDLLIVIQPATWKREEKRGRGIFDTKKLLAVDELRKTGNGKGQPFGETDAEFL